MCSAIKNKRINDELILRLSIFVCSMLFMAGLFFPTAAKASKIELRNMILDNQAGIITIRFGLDIYNTLDVKDVLQNGIKIKLNCNAKLYKGVNLWPDTLVAEKEYADFLSYDFLSKMYVLEKEGQKSPLRNKDLAKLLKEGWKTITIDVGSWSLLEKGEDYHLRLNVKMEQMDVPRWLKTTLFFWSWDVVPSASYQLNFTY